MTDRELAADGKDTGVGTAPSLLANRAFLALWSGQTVSGFGSAITVLAMPLLAIDQLGAQPGEIGLLRAAFTLSVLVVAVPGGVLVDRISKRRVMIVCDLVRAALLLSVPVAAATHLLSMPQLYLVAFLNGAFTLVFGLAYHGYLPVVAQRQRLAEANSKIASTEALARVSGPAVAAACVSLVGAARTILIDTVSFALSALTLAFTPADRPARARTARTPMLREAREGVTVVLADPVLTRTAVTTIGSMLALSMSDAVFVYFLVHDLRLPTGEVGAIYAIGEAGGLAAAVLAARIMRLVGSVRIMWLVVLLSPAGFLAAAASHGSALVLVGIFIALSSSRFVLFDIAQYTYRQLACPPEAFGRMTASIRLCIGIASTVGAGSGGLLGDLVGSRATIGIATAITCACGLPVLLSRLWRVRDIKDLTTTVDDTRPAAATS